MREITSTPAVERMASALDMGFSTVTRARAASMLRLLSAERDGERNAREIGDRYARDKDIAMNEQFKLLDDNGVDYSHLIS